MPANGCFYSERLLKYSLVELRHNKGINVEPWPYDFCHYFKEIDQKVDLASSINFKLIKFLSCLNRF